jgi:hypothetical protein
LLPFARCSQYSEVFEGVDVYNSNELIVIKVSSEKLMFISSRRTHLRITNDIEQLDDVGPAAQIAFARCSQYSEVFEGVDVYNSNELIVIKVLKPIKKVHLESTDAPADHERHRATR